jgi:methanogenic corrinoid protein MtbC1
MNSCEIREKLKESSRDWSVSEKAVESFRDSLPNILSLVNEKFRLESPHSEDQEIQQNYDFLMDSHRHFGEMLLAVYHFQIWDSLADEAVWYYQSVSSRGLNERYFSQMLKTWMIALYSCIKPPEAHQLTNPIKWLSENVYELSKLKEHGEALSEEASDLLDLLFRNEKYRAEQLLRAFFKNSNSDEALITQLTLPVLSEIGRLWRDNKISVADEHLAVANMRMIYQSFFRTLVPGEKRGQKIAVSCVPGEEHEIADELLSLYLERRGWPVSFIGHSTPEHEMLRMVGQYMPFALILSVTLVSHLPALESLVMELRERFPELRMLAGGSAVQKAKGVIQQIVDGVPESFEECHKILDHMVNTHA